MEKGCFCHFNGYEVKDAAARRNIETLQSDVSTLSDNVETIANNQIPEEYLQASVDAYMEENESGLATKTDLEELESQLSSEIAYGLIETNPIVFEIGSIYLNNGENNNREDRIRTGFIPVADKQTIDLGAIYEWNLWQYDENYNFIAVDSEAWKKGQVIDLSIYECAYVKVALLYAEIIYDCTIKRFYKISTIDEKIDNLSKKAELKKEYLKDKKVSFYGDSISTFKGWIPEGNRVYYTGSGNGITDVSQTWWKMLVDHYNMDLVVNNSWSGRCVTSKRDTEEGNLNSGAFALENILQLKTTEKEPEVIIIKLGVNDFLRLSDSLPFGEYDGHSEITEDSVTFKGAYALMMKRISETFPNAKVFCCTVNQFARSESGTFPQIRENVNLVDFNNAIIETASLFGAEVIRHDLCGITYFNSNVYMGDWNGTTGLHPNALGHELIGKLTIDFFKDREI